MVYSLYRGVYFILFTHNQNYKYAGNGFFFADQDVIQLEKE